MKYFIKGKFLLLFIQIFIFSLSIWGCGATKEQKEQIYQNGYNNGYNEGYNDGKQGVDDAFKVGYLRGYNDGINGTKSAVEMNQIRELVFASTATHILTYLLAILNILVLAGSLAWLIFFHHETTEIVIAKVFCGVVTTYLWFRFAEATFVQAALFATQNILGFGNLFVEIICFVIAIAICAIVDYIYIKGKAEGLWIDVFSIVFSVFLLLSYLTLLLNWKILSSNAGSPAFFLHIISALSIGGLSYVIVRIINSYDITS